jgi:hypothetical protein
MGQKSTVKRSARRSPAKPAAKPATKAAAKPGAMRGVKRPPLKPARPGEAVLLSGGNPQIAKGEGDGPVQAYLAAMPGWKSAIGERLDALIVRAVPGVQKAVKWNSPFYGVPGQGWFLSFHTFNRYVKLAFFFGSSLTPPPPEPSKDKNARYLHVHEDGVIDEAQLTRWVKQAAALPGWTP